MFVSATFHGEDGSLEGEAGSDPGPHISDKSLNAEDKQLVLHSLKSDGERKADLEEEMLAVGTLMGVRHYGRKKKA